MSKPILSPAVNFSSAQLAQFFLQFFVKNPSTGNSFLKLFISRSAILLKIFFLFARFDTPFFCKSIIHRNTIFIQADLLFYANFYDADFDQNIEDYQEHATLTRPDSNRLLYNAGVNLSSTEDAKYFDILLRYTEILFGTRASLLILRSPTQLLSKRDLLNILYLRTKISFWLNNVASRSWVYISTVIIFFFKTKDATLLSSWLHISIRKLSLFSHNRFFYLLFIFLNMSFVYFKGEYGLAGIRIRVAGKISVTGNARKRSMIFKKGITSSNNFQTKVSYDFYLVKTKTGCLGVSVYLYYF